MIVIYAEALLDLQLRFAHKVTDLSGLPLRGSVWRGQGDAGTSVSGASRAPGEPGRTGAPLQVLTAEASVLEFYDFYGI